MYEYIRQFKNLGLGLLVHLDADKADLAPDWAHQLVHLARQAGCRYVVFSVQDEDLYQNDAPHIYGRDLPSEFINACLNEEIAPFFYCSFMQQCDRAALIKIIERLCTGYGPVGGFCFDGMREEKGSSYVEKLYRTIRRLQPEAVIIDDTALDEQGEVESPEIDGVTLEKGKPGPAAGEGKPIAGQMRISLADFREQAPALLSMLIDCRCKRCNLLLEAHLQWDGTVTEQEKQPLLSLGNWIRSNKNFIYQTKPAGIGATNARILTDGEWFYAVIKDASGGNEGNIVGAEQKNTVMLPVGMKIKKPIWLDNGQPVRIQQAGNFAIEPFAYDMSLCIRVARFKLEA